MAPTPDHHVSPPIGRAIHHAAHTCKRLDENRQLPSACFLLGAALSSKFLLNLAGNIEASAVDAASPCGGPARPSPSSELGPAESSPVGCRGWRASSAPCLPAAASPGPSALRHCGGVQTATARREWPTLAVNVLGLRRRRRRSRSPQGAPLILSFLPQRFFTRASLGAHTPMGNGST